MDRDSALLEKYIGQQSRPHNEPFVRTSLGEVEIWCLVHLCLRRPKKSALQELRHEYELSYEEGEAAWLYINNNPIKALALNYSHTGNEEILIRVRVV